jgi:NMD protein affecting ribosome stability and mRNA decay
MTLAQMIARLTRGYIKETGRQPVGLDKLRIKMEAAEKLRQMKQSHTIPTTKKF